MEAFPFLACVGVLAGLSTRPAALQETPQEPKTTTIQVKRTKLLRVGGDLVGASLVTPKNEPLGKAEDLVIHPKGEIAFVEFTGAGSLNTGAARYPVAWRALERNEHGQLVLATTPDVFVRMPHYEGKPDLRKMDWWHDADAAYAKILAAKTSPVEASVSLSPGKELYLASDLRSRSIENPNGEKVATMHEIVVDPKVGRVAYVVLTVGGAAGAGEKMIAVPWEALETMPDKNNPDLARLTLATTREELEGAPEFQATTEGWAQASEPDYILRVYEFYSLAPYALFEKKATEPKKP